MRLSFVALPDVPDTADHGLETAVVMLILTLIIALVGGGIVRGLHRRLVRVIAAGLFTTLVATGLLLAIMSFYDPHFWSIRS